MKGIEKGRSFMGRVFTIHCDAKNLLYILSWRTLDKPKVSKSRRLTNWALSLLSFSFEIQHVPGHAKTTDELATANLIADLLTSSGASHRSEFVRSSAVARANVIRAAMPSPNGKPARADHYLCSIRELPIQ